MSTNYLTFKQKQMKYLKPILFFIFFFSVGFFGSRIIKRFITTAVESYSIYTAHDIIHVNGLEITFEIYDTLLTFDNMSERNEWIEEATAYASSTHGYKENLDWLVSQGYIYATTHHNEDEQYTELIYNGPNWTVDATRDTNYIITTFNHVEKLYDPSTKQVWYESYTVD